MPWDSINRDGGRLLSWVLGEPWICDGWRDLRCTVVFAGPLYAMNRVSTAGLFCWVVNTAGLVFVGRRNV